ncbi:MAG: hypothetical protein ACM3YF_05110, partial [Candidatus Zixiibacteriota bacterium]
ANIFTFPGPEMDLGVDYTLPQGSGKHYIGARGDTVYVVTSNGWTWCSKSTDGGLTFGLPVRVNSTVEAYNPSMRVDTAGGIYVAYQDEFADIRFTKSTDGGVTFTPGLKVNDDTIPQVGQEKPAIAVNNKGQIFIAWNDQRTAPGQPHKAIFATSSYDGGQTFTQNVQVNDSSDGAGVNDIAADDSGRVYVLHRGKVIVRSVDSGQSFSYRTYISEPLWLFGFESMAISGPLVGLFGEAGRFVGDSLEITLRFIVSTNYAETFQPSARVDDDTTGDFNLSILQASLFIHKSTFFASWSEERSGRDIFFSYSSDTGRTFAANKQVNSDSVANHTSPSLAVNEAGKAFVAWRDPRRDPWFGENWHTFVAVGNPTYLKGDLNLDLALTVADVVILINAVFLNISFPAPFENADVNCDGRLSPADLAAELQLVFLGRSSLICWF